MAKRSGSTCPWKGLSPNVRSRFICNSPQLERAQISFGSEWNHVAPHLSSGAAPHSNEGQATDAHSRVSERWSGRMLNQTLKTMFCVIPCVAVPEKTQPIHGQNPHHGCLGSGVVVGCDHRQSQGTFCSGQNVPYHDCGIDNMNGCICQSIFQ